MIQLYLRRYPSGFEIVQAKRPVDEIFFIVDGDAELITKKGQVFMHMPQSTVFGEHLVYYGLDATMTLRVRDVTCEGDELQEHHHVGSKVGEHKTSLMVIHEDVFLPLCEMYPESANRMREMALVKREAYMHYRELIMKRLMHRDAGEPRNIESPEHSHHEDSEVELGDLSDNDMTSHLPVFPVQRLMFNEEECCHLAYRFRYIDIEVFRDLQHLNQKQFDLDVRLEIHKFLVLKQINHQGHQAIKGFLTKIS